MTSNLRFCPTLIIDISSKPVSLHANLYHTKTYLIWSLAMEIVKLCTHPCNKVVKSTEKKSGITVIMRLNDKDE